MAKIEKSGFRSWQEVPTVCDEFQLANGDTLYTSEHINADLNFPLEDNPTYKLVISPLGKNLIKNGMKLIQLLDKSNNPFFYFGRKYLEGNRGHIIKENIDNMFRGHYNVALKRLNPEIVDTTGIEQFQAMRALEDEGVLCATPLLATRLSIISTWIDGKLPKDQQIDKALTNYLIALDQVASRLKTEGKWKEEWKIEAQPGNYIVRNLDAENPLHRFFAIDAVFIHSFHEN